MSLYVDTSALLKRYLLEAESESCGEILDSAPRWVTARHTWVEAVRNLARLLSGKDLEQQLKSLEADWASMDVVELDRETCRMAADLTRSHPIRSLDALHLASALRAGGRSLPLLTYDRRLADAARAFGVPVLGSP